MSGAIIFFVSSTPLSAVQLSSSTTDPVGENHVYDDIHKYNMTNTNHLATPLPMTIMK